MPPGPARLMAPTSPRAFRTRTTPSATGPVTVPPAATATGRVPPGPVTVACTAVSPALGRLSCGDGPAGTAAAASEPSGGDAGNQARSAPRSTVVPLSVVGARSAGAAEEITETRAAATIGSVELRCSPTAPSRSPPRGRSTTDPAGTRRCRVAGEGPGAPARTGGGGG